MFISSKDIDRIVKNGESAQFNYWVYDIIANRLEATGFRRSGGIAQGVDGSMYCNPDGVVVFVSTHRPSQVTMIRSVLSLPGNNPAPAV